MVVCFLSMDCSAAESVFLLCIMAWAAIHACFAFADLFARLYPVLGDKGLIAWMHFIHCMEILQTLASVAMPRLWGF